MNRTRSFAVGLAVLIGIGPLSAGAGGGAGEEHAVRFPQDPPPIGHVPGEVLVKFKPGVEPAAREMLVTRLGGLPAAALSRDSVARIRLPPGLSALDAVRAYRNDPDVEYAQPNYVYRPLALPDDPQFGELWGLKNAGQAVKGVVGLAGSDMGMEAAWDKVTDCSPTVVAVLDTGVNYTHADLAGNMWDGGPGYPHHGTDFVDGDDDPMPADASSHGTHVAGTIGAVGNNGVGVTGVCWTARIMAVRVLSDEGGTTADIVQGIEFAVANGAKVINMSFGGEAGLHDQYFSEAIAAAAARDVLVVAAAGNDARDNDPAPLVPCGFDHDNLLCVAALDQEFGLAGFSNWGETSVDVGAPGVNILSTWAGRSERVSLAAGAWAKTGGWAEVSCNFGYGPVEMLANPGGWCSGQSYANNSNDVAWRRFDLSGALAAAFEAYVSVDAQADRDYFSVAHDGSGGNPFVVSGAERVVDRFSGSTEGFTSLAFPLSHCLTEECAVGFQFTSDRRGTDRGVAITSARLHKAESGSAALETLQGTSMATPHVAGLAALIRAYNPRYTYADVAAAIRAGGVPVASLSGLTVTGRAANALGSLAHINPPSGVTAVVE